MKTRFSCVAVTAVVALAAAASVNAATVAHIGGTPAQAAATSGSMTPEGVQAWSARYQGMADAYLGQQGSMTPEGIHAWSDRYQGMAVNYLLAQQAEGVPVQWHDVFTGVGATLGALALLGLAVELRRVRHRHGARATFAH